jgi:hypothetical protein
MLCSVSCASTEFGNSTSSHWTCVQGIVCSGVAYYVQGLVSRQRGPVFVTAFSPFCMIVTALMGSVILKEEIRLGR